MRRAVAFLLSIFGGGVWRRAVRRCRGCGQRAQRLPLLRERRLVGPGWRRMGLGEQPVLRGPRRTGGRRGRCRVSFRDALRFLLGERSWQPQTAGANVLDLAVAMLETENMITNYPYADNKSGDAANFGIFKQNWLMLRSACHRFRGRNTSQWNNGSALNNNLFADVSCLRQSQNHYGIDRWFAGHRNGETGLNNPTPPTSTGTRPRSTGSATGSTAVRATSATTPGSGWTCNRPDMRESRRRPGGACPGAGWALRGRPPASAANRNRRWVVR